MNLLKKSLAVEPNGVAANFGHLFLRVSAGIMNKPEEVELVLREIRTLI